MNHELDLLHSEIERLIHESDDWFEITALQHSDGWKALLRRMAVTEETQLQQLLNEKDHAEMRYVQGYLKALGDIRNDVAESESKVEELQGELAERQQEKDQELVQTE